MSRAPQQGQKLAQAHGASLEIHGGAELLEIVVLAHGDVYLPGAAQPFCEAHQVSFANLDRCAVGGRNRDVALEQIASLCGVVGPWEGRGLFGPDRPLIDAHDLQFCRRRVVFDRNGRHGQVALNG